MSVFVLPAGQEDLGCKMNGITYQEGQFFQPSCDTRCQCRGGGISCVPACPLDVRPPTPDCPHPQHVRLPGKCCKEWVCENLENTVIQDAITGEVLRLSVVGDRSWVHVSQTETVILHSSSTAMISVLRYCPSILPSSERKCFQFVSGFNK